jgi:hypothetical protein
MTDRLNQPVDGPVSEARPRAESAENHCQAGNFGLALQVIAAWLNMQGARAQPA